MLEYLVQFSLWQILAVLTGVLLTYKLVGLTHYVLQAKQTRLPYVITPFLETEITGYFLSPVFRHVFENRLLRGNGFPRWCRFVVKEWAWEDRRRAHEEYGETFLVVSPEGIICYSADALLSRDVFNRRNVFLKPLDKYIELYGPNVATSEGRTYQFHVRITANPFNDVSGVNELVWFETMKQTELLKDSWVKTESGQLQLDVNGLTLAVICKAGYGREAKWTSNAESSSLNLPAGYKLSILKAIHDTTKHMAAILLFPGWLLRMTPLRKANLAHEQLDKYLRQMIRSEKRAIAANKHHESKCAKGNLLTSVIRASAAQDNAKQGSNDCSRNRGFTEDEIMGNLYIFLLAGYETTANSIIYGLVSLALYPEIQERVIEEIDRVFHEAKQQGRDQLTYADDFDKLQYTYGFMYEMFRLYPGVTMITKMIHNHTEIETCIAGDSAPTTHTLPAGCRVYLNVPGTHYSERYWPSACTLDPTRWLSDPSNYMTPGSHESIIGVGKLRPVQGTFMTFSDGSRACLGRKFAQAEFIAFFATLLRQHTIVLGNDMDRETVEKDIKLRSAGKITLGPLDNVKLGLRNRF